MDFKDRSYNPPVNACIQDNFLQEGISLLDHFAGLAMQGICVNAGRNGYRIDKPEEIAKESFALAKAMLKARKETLKDG